jgi:hypothetical protein
MIHTQFISYERQGQRVKKFYNTLDQCYKTFFFLCKKVSNTLECLYLASQSNLV